MPRNRRIFQSDYPYHVTMRALNKEPFPLDMTAFWQFTSDLLLFSTYAFDIKIHSFVLMSNHYHLMVTTPKLNLNKFMNYFNRELSREIGYQSGRINQKFGSRYGATIVSDNSYLHATYKYIYRNPVDAKICKKVEDYNFSSLRFITGRERYLFPIHDPYFAKLEDYWNNLQWLNSEYKDEDLKQIYLDVPDFRPTI